MCDVRAHRAGQQGGAEVTGEEGVHNRTSLLRSWFGRCGDAQCQELTGLNGCFPSASYGLGKLQLTGLEINLFQRCHRGESLFSRLAVLSWVRT